MFDYGLTQQQVTNEVQQVLRNLRTALEAAQDLYGWSSTIAPSDLVALGYVQADAQAILDAAADANSLAILYNGGVFDPIGTGTYNFSASNRRVIGPQ